MESTELAEEPFQPEEEEEEEGVKWPGDSLVHWAIAMRRGRETDDPETVGEMLQVVDRDMLFPAPKLTVPESGRFPTMHSRGALQASMRAAVREVAQFHGFEELDASAVDSLTYAAANYMEGLIGDIRVRHREVQLATRVATAQPCSNYLFAAVSTLLHTWRHALKPERGLRGLLRWYYRTYVESAVRAVASARRWLDWRKTRDEGAGDEEFVEDEIEEKAGEPEHGIGEIEGEEEEEEGDPLGVRFNLKKAEENLEDYLPLLHLPQFQDRPVAPLVRRRRRGMEMEEDEEEEEEESEVSESDEEEEEEEMDDESDFDSDFLEGRRGLSITPPGSSEPAARRRGGRESEIDDDSEYDEDEEYTSCSENEREYAEYLRQNPEAIWTQEQYDSLQEAEARERAHRARLQQAALLQEQGLLERHRQLQQQREREQLQQQQRLMDESDCEFMSDAELMDDDGMVYEEVDSEGNRRIVRSRIQEVSDEEEEEDDDGELYPHYHRM